MSTDMSRRQVLAAGAALAGSAALATGPLGAAAAAGAGRKSHAKPTIVLVHGGYADSSCWNDTIKELQHKGYTTIAGSNPLRGVATDAPYIASLLDSINGPVVLVAHSMGGTVITNAAAGKSNVKALVYIAAFVPDVGESQGELIGKFPGSEIQAVSVPVPYTKPDGTQGTDLYLSTDGQAAFAADVLRSDVPAPAGHPATLRRGLLHPADHGGRVEDDPVLGAGRRQGQDHPAGAGALDVPARQRPQDRRGATLLPRRDDQQPVGRRQPHRGRRQGNPLTPTTKSPSTQRTADRGDHAIEVVDWAPAASRSRDTHAD